MVELGKSGVKCDKEVKILLKLLSIILIFIIISTIITISCRKCAAESGSSYVVMYQKSGQILAGNNMDLPLPMASTTKIATAVTVLNSCELSQEVIIPEQAVGIEGSSVYLKQGERFTVLQLLYALMLQSGNDAAVALALHAGGNMDNFVKMMNDYAHSLHLENTHFCNPHGLHDDEHYTSARDLALITSDAMNNATFREIVSAKKFDIPASEYTAARTWYNKNKMLNMYDGANGVKTGYTTKAGRCLVSAAERDGMQLVCVVLNHYNMWQDSMAYMDKAFSDYSAVRGADEGEELYGGEGVAVSVRGGLDFAAKKSDIGKLRYEITALDRLDLPVKAGSDIGRIEVFADNRLLFSSALYTINDITDVRQLYAVTNYDSEMVAEYGSEAEQISCKLRSGVAQGRG